VCVLLSRFWLYSDIQPNIEWRMSTAHAIHRPFRGRSDWWREPVCASNVSTSPWRRSSVEDALDMESSTGRLSGKPLPFPVAMANGRWHHTTAKDAAVTPPMSSASSSSKSREISSFARVLVITCVGVSGITAAFEVGNISIRRWHSNQLIVVRCPEA